MTLIDDLARPAAVPPADEGVNLESYALYVAEMARRADATMILNHSERHAEVVLAQIFRTATSNVKILTGCLLDRVYGSVRISNAIDEFGSLESATIEIIHERDLEPNNRLVDRLRRSLGARFTIRRMDGNAGAHFAVADSQHLRFESDDANGEGVVYFGNRIIGARLNSIFDRFMARA